MSAPAESVTRESLTREADGSPARREALRVGRIAAFLSLLLIAFNTAEGVWSAAKAGAIGPTLAVIIAVGAVAAVPYHLRGWAVVAYRSLTELPFAIAALGLLGGATMIGTWVHEPRSPEVFFGRYGAIAPLLAWLHLDDVFRATWYRGLLGFAAVSLCAVIVARRPWRSRQLGFLLSHTGAVSILIGGAVGTWFGSRGVIQLGVGESVRSYLGTKGQQIELPFLFRLDGFETVRGSEILRLYETDGRARIFAVYPAAEGTKARVSGTVSLEVSSVSKGPQGPRVELSIGPVRRVVLERDGVSVAEVGPGRYLRLAKRGDEIEDFVSTFSIVDGERVVGGKTSVNQPFVYAGYRFYQASYDPKDGRQSGVLVVRDPGLGISRAGLVLTALGVFHILFLRSRRAA
ncbi:MAG: cytochrome c biogenesis protein ResB [Deltaproteobacteria bacterium]|nr:cytochrome c biogenesis protein ResB [Deltaproteobacteria bacterium]